MAGPMAVPMASPAALFLVAPTTPGTIPVTDTDDARGGDIGESIDSSPLDGILTTKAAAHYLQTSESWVYKHWRDIGGVKIGGKLFFPSKEKMYERLFGKGQGLAGGFHAGQAAVHPSLVRDKNKGKAGRGTSPKSITDTDPNRHGILGSGQPKT